MRKFEQKFYIHEHSLGAWFKIDKSFGKNIWFISLNCGLGRFHLMIDYYKVFKPTTKRK